MKNRRTLALWSLALLGLSGCHQDVMPPPPSAKSVWVVFHKSAGTLLDDKINSLMLGTDATVWIATDAGASNFKRGVWGMLADSLRGYRVNSIVEAKDKSIWFCLSGGGVVRYNPLSPIAVWRRFTEPDLIYDVVLSGAADRSNRTQFGEVWFATVLGISRFIQSANEQGRWLKYSQNDSGEHVPAFPSSTFLTASVKLDDNTIWFGAENGGAVWVTYGLANLQWNRIAARFGDPRIISLGFDLGQHVWLGRDAGGVSGLDFTNYTWQEYNTVSTHGVMPGGRVNAIATDYLFNRWFGTDSGLVHLDHTALTVFTARSSPLPGDTVTALTYDVRGNLWIGTNRGLAVYNEQGVEY